VSLCVFRAQASAEALKAIEIKISAKAGGEKLFGSIKILISLML
jgi:ribosomal protein L9